MIIPGSQTSQITLNWKKKTYNHIPQSFARLLVKVWSDFFSLIFYFPVGPALFVLKLVVVVV